MVVGAEEREEQLEAVDSRGVADEKDEYVVDRRRDTWSTVPKVADTCMRDHEDNPKECLESGFLINARPQL